MYVDTDRCSTWLACSDWFSSAVPVNCEQHCIIFVAVFFCYARNSRRMCRNACGLFRTLASFNRGSTLVYWWLLYVPLRKRKTYSGMVGHCSYQQNCISISLINATGDNFTGKLLNKWQLLWCHLTKCYSFTITGCVYCCDEYGHSQYVRNPRIALFPSYCPSR